MNKPLPDSDPTLADCCAMAANRCYEAEDAIRLAHIAACNDEGHRAMELLLREAIGEARALQARVALIASIAS